MDDKIVLFIDLDQTLYDYELCNQVGYCQIKQYCQDQLTITDQLLDQARQQVKHQLGPTAACHHRLLYFQTLVELLNHQLDQNKPQLPISVGWDLNQIYWQAYWDRLDQSDQPYPGIENFLKWCQSQGIYLGIISNFLSEYQYQKLQRLDLLNYFDLIICSEEAGVEKPDLKIFQLAQRKAEALIRSQSAPLSEGDKENNNQPPIQYWMIGDSQSADIQGALAAGFQWTGWFRPDLQEPLPTFLSTHSDQGQFSDWSQLLDYLSEMMEDVQLLCQLCQNYGSELKYVQAGGGNISVKNWSRDQLLIKSSGYQLKQVGATTGWTSVQLSKFNPKYVGQCLTNSLDNKREREQIVTQQALAARSFGSQERPSIETIVHSCLPDRIVCHLHYLPVMAIYSLLPENNRRQQADQALLKLFPERIIIPYQTPGWDLALAIESVISQMLNTKQICEKVIILENHGLIITGSEAEDIQDIINQLDDWAMKQELVMADDVRGLDTKCYHLGPSLKLDLVSLQSQIDLHLSKRDQDIPTVIRPFHQSLVSFDELFRLTFCPDLIVFAGPAIAWLPWPGKKEAQIDQVLATCLANFYQQWETFPKVLCSWDKKSDEEAHHMSPKLYLLGTSEAKCESQSEVIWGALNCRHWLGRKEWSNIQQLSMTEILYLNNCEMEKYRQ